MMTSSKKQTHCFLYLMKDGTFLIANKKWERPDLLQAGITCYQMRDETPVIEICEWMAGAYRDTKYIQKVEV